MELAVAALLAATVVKVVDLGRQVYARKYRDAAMQLFAYVTGVGVVLVFAQTPWAESVVLEGVTLAGANVFTMAVMGIVVASAGSLTHDVVKAFSPKATAEPATFIRAHSAEGKGR